MEKWENYNPGRKKKRKYQQPEEEDIYTLFLGIMLKSKNFKSKSNKNPYLQHESFGYMVLVPHLYIPNCTAWVMRSISHWMALFSRTFVVLFQVDFTWKTITVFFKSLSQEGKYITFINQRNKSRSLEEERLYALEQNMTDSISQG